MHSVCLPAYLRAWPIIDAQEMFVERMSECPTLFHLLVLSHPLLFHERISHLHTAWRALPFCLPANSLYLSKFSSYVYEVLHSRQNWMELILSP